MRTLFILSVLLLKCIVISSNINAGIIVDRSGRGHFRNISEALDSLKMKDADKTATIYIRDGFYKEKLHLTSDITNVRIIGESKEGTIINYDDHANIDNMRTFKTYTFKVEGCDLLFENLTIENSALQLGQAVAIHVTGDRIVFRNCRFLGNQDTIYAGEADSRHYFENCYVEGTTDFIFGPATAYFQNCKIVCKKNSYITAPNTPEQQKYGLIFNECHISLIDGVDKVYLGRPWRPHGMSLFMNCYLGEGIVGEGWNNWGKETNEDTTRFAEYNNYGAGSDFSKRVRWSRVLSGEDAKEYTVKNILSGKDNWNPLLIK